MTEMVNGMSQSQETSSSQPVTAAVSEPKNLSNSSIQSADERNFKQSEVNEIVKNAKRDAVDSFRRMQVEQPNYAQQKYGETSNTNYANNQNFQAPNNDENIRKIAAEESARHIDAIKQDALKQHENEMAKRTVQNFFGKISKGREKYSDFDTVTGDVQLGRFPNVVGLLGDIVENSDDVFYELSKDRIKMSQLEQLYERSPEDAIYAAKRLSQSIKDNNEAAKIRTPNEPLSQMRPSNTGTDNGVMSVKDYRAKYRV